MTNSCDCQNHDCNCNSTSGFIFGLLCGAIIGAIVAILIYKKNKTEVFEKISKKIKDFFDNLIKTNKNIPPNKSSSSPKESLVKILANSNNLPSNPKITPVFIKSQKLAPKTFIKAKK